MKKVLFISILALIIIVYGVYHIWFKAPTENALINKDTSINKTETKETWKTYENKDAGFSIKYPDTVSLNKKEADKQYRMIVDIEPVSSLKGTMGFNKETALKNIESLSKGEYGIKVDWPVKESRRIRKIGNTYAQDFIVLSRFEVCDVVFERKLYFFNNDYQIIVTLIGPKEGIITSLPSFFVSDKDNCGQDKRWDFKKQEEFIGMLNNGKAPKPAQDWFNLFDKIVETIKVKQNESLLIGKWKSLDDEKYVVEFKGNKKIDYYTGKKMSEGIFSFDEAKKSLTVTDKNEIFKYSVIKLSKNTLELMYLPRGNILRYKKISE